MKAFALLTCHTHKFTKAQVQDAISVNARCSFFGKKRYTSIDAQLTRMERS